MKRILVLYNRLSHRTKVSAKCAAGVIGLVSTVMSVTGGTLYECTGSWCISITMVAVAWAVMSIATYYAIGKLYKDSVSLVIRQTPVTIRCGDLFKAHGMRVISCDSRFDTRVDDVVIAKSSLHGKLFLEHGVITEIDTVVEKDARRRCLEMGRDERYDFPLGSIVRYDSSVDNETYLMLALSRLDDDYKASTCMAEFEQMLMEMWNEIDRVYVGNPVVMPVLGSGLLRFTDGPKSREALLRCILCTLNASGVSLKSRVEIVLDEDAEDIPLFEYKDMFRSFTGA